MVNSCSYYPTQNIEVILPDEKEAKILTHQNKYSLHLPLQVNKWILQSDFPVGLAIDVGTTSMVFYWVSLITGQVIRSIGVGNPQVKYGADVITRITFCTDATKVRILQEELVRAVNQQIDHFVTQEGIQYGHIVKVSVSANTTMLHLLAGVNPGSLALAPFKAQFLEARVYHGSELRFRINSAAEVHLMPSISAYVGADIVSGLASLYPQETVKNYLFIDIGTNGEMAVVTPQKIFCCATAAGPALEGANIYCGMAAFDGAISAFDAYGYQTIGNEKPIGICGSGLLDVMAYLLDRNIVLADGTLNNDFVLVPKEEAGNNEDIVITPQDIREIQLAKSAFFTGIKLLVQEAGLTFEKLDALFLAGGFGNYLNPESAVTIGLFPKELLGKVITVGNTSGTGAVLNTISTQYEQYTDAVIKKAQLIELAKHPDFELEYAMNMFF